VPVEEDLEQTGDRVTFTYRLDVCPASEGMLRIAHRDFHVTQINGQTATDAVPAQDLHRIQSLTSLRPVMFIDHAGTLVAVGKVVEMIDRIASAYPDVDFSAMRRLVVEGSAVDYFKQMMETIWLRWVEGWMQVDPSRGSEQELSPSPDVTPSLIKYLGSTSEHRARFSSLRVLSPREASQFTGTIFRALLPDLDADAAMDHVTTLVEVETDWPGVRPWVARQHNKVHFSYAGTEQTMVMDVRTRFDWRAANAKDVKCR
jgi:hypothetical protein